MSGFMVPVLVSLFFFCFVLLLIRMCLQHNERVERMKLEAKYGYEKTPERVIDYSVNRQQ